jgi:hypothetical protein
MKMKTVFLSMLAIAALASCSRQEFIDPHSGPQEGDKMLVDITLGNGQMTKAGNVATAEEDKTISNVTVFFLNATNQIVSRHYVDATKGLTDDETDPAIKKATIETRTTATQMMVIANIGDDLTVTGKPLNVSTRDQLEKKEQDLIISDGQTLPAMVPFQTKGDVLMSGEGQVENMTSDPETGNSTATAAVELNYISAKITLAKIAVSENTLGTYGEDFKFTRAFLLKVQTKSRYFPTAGKYLPAAKEYANGIWVNAWGEDTNPTVDDFVQTLSIPTISTSSPATDIAHWYVFENDPASVQSTDNPTVLVVEVEWTKTKADEAAGIQEEKVNKLFNVIFAPGDKGVIAAGKAYNVELTFNGDFRPENEGGTGGGGADEPDQPNVSASVDITVTPASWAEETTPKPF